MKAGIQVQSIKKAFLPPDIVAPPNPPKNILNNSSGVISATYIKKDRCYQGHKNPVRLQYHLYY